MKHIDQIRALMEQSESIAELGGALKEADIPAYYMAEADDSIKKEHGINLEEKWHRFGVETDLKPINKWENLPQYTIIAISDDLQQLRVIGPFRGKK